MALKAVGSNPITHPTSEWTTRHSKSPAAWLGISHTPSFFLFCKKSRCTFAVRLRSAFPLTILRLAPSFLRDAPAAHGIFFVPGRHLRHLLKFASLGLEDDGVFVVRDVYETSAHMSLFLRIISCGQASQYEYYMNCRKSLDNHAFFK